MYAISSLLNDAMILGFLKREKFYAPVRPLNIADLNIYKEITGVDL
jgi:hypothetical protein